MAVCGAVGADQGLWGLFQIGCELGCIRDVDIRGISLENRGQ